MRRPVYFNVRASSKRGLERSAQCAWLYKLTERDYTWTAAKLSGNRRGFTYVGKPSPLNKKKFHGRFVIAMCASILNFETITESNLLINEVFWGHFLRFADRFISL